MDDMECIENRMLLEQSEQSNASAPVENGSLSFAAPAVLKAAKAAMEKAEDLVNNPKNIDKHARDLEGIARDMIENQLETERLKIDKEAADNKVARKNIKNDLYKAKQRGVRLRKEAKHESKMQRQRHISEVKKAYWESHQDTLLQYGMKEGSSRVACAILLFLDGVKGFFTGIGKVSDALIKALKWIIALAVIIGVLMIVPVSRIWLLSILGFIKK